MTRYFKTISSPKRNIYYIEAFVLQLDEDDLLILEQCNLPRVSQLRRDDEVDESSMRIPLKPAIIFGELS